MTSTPVTSETSYDLAEALNHGCLCQTLDPAQLRAELARDSGLRSVAQTLPQTHPHLFSNTAVFASRTTVQAVQDAVATIERTMSMPAWAQQVLPDASAIAQADHGPLGVFMGYDFHITPAGPKLIEINTNAGGAMLNAVLLQAQAVCCGMLDPLRNAHRGLAALEEEFVAMFRSEWQRYLSACGSSSRELRSVAIVDDAPESQYLAPEFALFADVFKRHGIAAHVIDASDLHLEGHVLFAGEAAIDLVYNRLTDFNLSDPRHAALAQAYGHNLAAVTPHPRAHALRANKQHLVTLGQRDALEAMGIPERDLRVLLVTVPPCERVSAKNAAALWARRKQLFFKPLDGFGARAVYRGDKLTQKVWSEIQQGEYIAQALVPAPTRVLQVGEATADLEFDVRAYTYAGHVQLLAARTYSGQTTNFRTDGGGFAPVMWVPDLPLTGALAQHLPCHSSTC